jgi:hypothetical protein
MKFVSPRHRGTTWVWRWSIEPPAPSPRLSPVLNPSGSISCRVVECRPVVHVCVGNHHRVFGVVRGVVQKHVVVLATGDDASLTGVRALGKHTERAAIDRVCVAFDPLDAPGGVDLVHVRLTPRGRFNVWRRCLLHVDRFEPAGDGHGSQSGECRSGLAVDDETILAEVSWSIVVRLASPMTITDP